MKKIVHTTKLKIDRQVLADSIAQAKERLWRSQRPHSSDQRRTLCSLDTTTWTACTNDCSASSIQKTASQLRQLVKPSLKPCARVYYSPSFTSQPADFRRAVVPLNPNNKFLFFDLKAAEFFLSCYFAGEVEVWMLISEEKTLTTICHITFPPRHTEKALQDNLARLHLWRNTLHHSKEVRNFRSSSNPRLHNAVYRALP